MGRYGAVYGLESLSQLVDRGTFVNGTTITDFPRYQCVVARAYNIDRMGGLRFNFANFRARPSHAAIARLGVAAARAH